ncbi:hypothetical protein FQZ97_808530 [compost metagenome]
MVQQRVFGREGHVVQARGGVAVGVGHQVHQQHAFEEVVRRGHAHAGRGQAVERIDLGALPDGLGHLAAEARALGHGARLAGVLHAPVLGVVDGLAEAALVGFLVDLGAARVLAAAHDVHHGLLAAHELAHDAVDQPFVDEGLQSGGCLHACASGTARGRVERKALRLSVPIW